MSRIPDTELRERFLQLSAAVTGFDCSMLTGTGLLGLYFRACRNLAGKQTFDRILCAWDPKDPLRFEPADVDTVNNIVGVWYLGKWLPSDEILSPAAYREALAWSVVHAHPPGAKQPGFGSWQEAPND